MLSFFKNKLEFKLSFFVCVIIMIALKLTEQFFIIFFVVSIHELTHVFVAGRFGLKTEKIIFTPIGQIAAINNIEQTGRLKKVLILIAGPAINFCMAATAFYILGKNSFFVAANLSIGIFNLLPVYPLDGGRILHAVLESIIGTLRANKIIINISGLFSKVLIFLGIIQVVVYPFNISLLIIGVYIGKLTEEERIFLAISYYKDQIIVNYLPFCSKHKENET